MDSKTLAQIINQGKATRELYKEYYEFAMKTGDRIEASNIICMLSQGITITGFNEYFDICLEVCSLFENEMEDKKITLNIYFSYVVLYFYLGYYALVIEKGLKLINSGEQNLIRQAATCNYVGLSLTYQGLNERAIIYFTKAYQLFIIPNNTFYTEEQKTQMIMSYYQSVVINCLALNRIGDAEAAYKKSLELYNESLDGTYKKTFINDKEHMRLMLDFKNNKPNIIEDFIVYMENCINEMNFPDNQLMTFNDFVPFIKMLYNKEEYQKVLKYCQFLLSSKSFIGDSASIYEYLIKAMERENSSSQMILDAYVEYTKRLEGLNNKNSQVLRTFIDEQFRLSNIEAQYLDISQKYIIDSLSMCYNRPGMETRGIEFYNATKKGTVVFMDLDKLKTINDAYGHHFGDAYIREFASSVKSYLDDRSDLYRYGGDEFVILSSIDETEMKQLINNIAEILKHKQTILDKKLSIEFTAGIIQFNESYKPKLSEIIRHADTVMYENKKRPS